MPTPIDLTGKVFGRLTVESESTSRASAAFRYWDCKCECGQTKSVRGGHLLQGRIISCGCVQKERTSAARKTHGLSRSKVYAAWCKIRRRCYCHDEPYYSNYGGRGIYVSKLWMNDFEAFLNHVGEPPSVDMSIDRIDTNGNYEPGNVRWATQKQQQRNRRDNHIVVYRGESLTLAELAERYNVKAGRVGRRLKRGWSIEDAVNQPPYSLATR